MNIATTENVRMLRYGSKEPLPSFHTLQAGAVELQLSDGMLRYIKYNGCEVVRGIYAAVRDKNWGTVAPNFTSMDIEDRGREGFRVIFVSEHKNDEIDFIWKGTIEGSADGTIKYTMDGHARKTFLKNRIGFCILHPIHLAGQPVEITTTDGVKQGYFPEQIAPKDPFLNMTAMRHPVAPGVEVRLTFEGDLFETEDQRNWTDASYKTFCTPLGLPFPVEIKQEEVVRQSVTLEFSATSTVQSVDTPTTNRERTLTISNKTVGNLPKVGLGLAPLERELSEGEMQRLQLLKASHFHLKLDLTAARIWKAQLEQAHRTCKELGADLELEIVVDQGGELLSPLFEHISSQAIQVARMKVYPNGAYVTPHNLTKQARAIVRKYGLDIAIGCGTRANFAEFNRAELPLLEAEYAFYSINAQTHAFDIASLTETLEAQRVTAESAKAIIGSVPLHIGPVTLKPRVNPVAATPEDAQKAEQRSNQTDHRLFSLYGAGWTLGSISSLAKAAPESLTYHEHIGKLGIMEEGGEYVSPSYHVLTDLGEFAGAEMLSTEGNDPLQFVVLALRQGNKVRILAANVTNEPIAIRLQTSALGHATVRRLDEETASLPREQLVASAIPLKSYELTLLPFATISIDSVAKEETDFLKKIGSVLILSKPLSTSVLP
jgi:D-apionolactonase